MLCLDTDLGVLGSGGVSMLYKTSASQYLSMTDANFGEYDKAKFAISAWVKRASTVTGFRQGIYTQMGSGANDAFELFFENPGELTFNTTGGGGQLSTTAVYNDTANYHHFLAHYDSANTTPNDRMRLWYDGTEITTFTARLNPSAAVNNSTSPIIVGAGSNGLSSWFDGLMYQVAFFSGSLPAVSVLRSTITGKPLNITGVAGLWSLLDVASGAVTSDYVLAANWSNNNGVLASGDAP